MVATVRSPSLQQRIVTEDDCVIIGVRLLPASATTATMSAADDPFISTTPAESRRRHETRTAPRPDSRPGVCLSGCWRFMRLRQSVRQSLRQSEAKHTCKTHQMCNTSLIDEVATGHSYPSVGRRCPLFYPAPSPTPWVTRTCNGSQKVARSVHLMQTLPSSIQTGANVCRTREQSIEQTMDVVYL